MGDRLERDRPHRGMLDTKADHLTNLVLVDVLLDGADECDGSCPNSAQRSSARSLGRAADPCRGSSELRLELEAVELEIEVRLQHCELSSANQARSRAIRIPFVFSITDADSLRLREWRRSSRICG